VWEGCDVYITSLTLFCRPFDVGRLGGGGCSTLGGWEFEVGSSRLGVRGVVVLVVNLIFLNIHTK
jgi:hypothetical protein